MNQSDGLPSETKLVLQQAVARAFNLTLGGQKNGCSARTFSEVAVSIDDFLRDALIRAKRSYNFLCSRQARLPAEVWALVWTHLPLQDCIAVSHVCHAWRKNSISCPRLWDEVTVVSKVCVCLPCLRAQELRGFENSIAGVHPKFSPTNLPLLPILLQRGRQLPFSLTVEVTGHVLNEEMTVLRLARALVPHAARVSDITISMPYHQLLYRFFAQFPAFPAATDLEITGNPDAPQRGSFLIPEGVVSFPLVQYLVLSRDIQWPEADAFVLPSLRELECSFSSFAELQRIVASCPNLATWTVRAPFRLAGAITLHPVATRDLALKMRNVEVLRLLDVDSTYLPALIVLFGSSIRPELEISFETLRARQHIAFALSILRHGAGPVGLRCTLAKPEAPGRGRTLTLTVICVQGLRTLRIPMGTDIETLLPHIWSSVLPTATVCVLGACLTAWPLICKSQPPPNLSKLVDLHVFVDEAVQALEPVCLGLPAAPAFTMLHTLTVMAESPTITLPVAWLCSLIQSLELRRELPLLNIRNTSIVGPIELLRGLVMEIKDADRGNATIVSFTRSHRD